jgi:hypothetical protein
MAVNMEISKLHGVALQPGRPHFQNKIMNISVKKVILLSMQPFISMKHALHCTARSTQPERMANNLMAFRLSVSQTTKV